MIADILVVEGFRLWLQDPYLGNVPGYGRIIEVLPDVAIDSLCPATTHVEELFLVCTLVLVPAVDVHNQRR